MHRMKEKKHIPTNGKPIAWTSPFAALKQVKVPPTSDPRPVADRDVEPDLPKKNRGRVDIIRQTAHRGGKTVTVVTGFVGIGQVEKERLAKEIQKACGTGGTVKEGRIEIQGDQREAVTCILTKAGFRPVSAGG
jgi:translation initiation factor 1